MPQNRNQPSAACDCRTIHEDVVARVKLDMPRSETLFDAAEFFRVFGDSTRMGLLCALSRSEMCGCDLCSLLNMTQSAVSHQLRILKQARLVRYRREGKIIYFRLDDAHIDKILKLGIEHTTE